MTIPHYNTSNGAKPRYDNGGSSFGMIHRDLGPSYCMLDLDRMNILIESEINLRRENEAFVEYRHSGDNIIFVALFEYKAHKNERSLLALNPNDSTSRVRAKIAELLGCRLFIVYATNKKAPFEFWEWINNEFVMVGVMQSNEVQNFWNNVLNINKNGSAGKSRIRPDQPIPYQQELL